MLVRFRLNSAGEEPRWEITGDLPGVACGGITKKLKLEGVEFEFSGCTGESS